MCIRDSISDVNWLPRSLWILREIPTRLKIPINASATVLVWISFNGTAVCRNFSHFNLLLSFNFCLLGFNFCLLCFSISLNFQSFIFCCHLFSFNFCSLNFCFFCFFSSFNFRLFCFSFDFGFLRFVFSLKCAICFLLSPFGFYTLGDVSSQIFPFVSKGLTQFHERFLLFGSHFQ